MTASRAFVTSGAEYSGCAWSTYSRAPLVRMTFAAPRSSTAGSGGGAAVYVHLRTPDKDVLPSTWDCWAGGVVAAGETPAGCARRDLAEELGISGVPPEPLFTKVYDDGSNRCHNFAFEIRWDGPIHHQAEEIVEGHWIQLTELRAWVDDPAPSRPFIPDGREGIQEWFRRYG